MAWKILVFHSVSIVIPVPSFSKMKTMAKFVDKGSPSPEVVCFGEVLWDLLPLGAVPGGAPMNVAYHLSQAGISSGVISRIGRDDLGKALKQQLEKWQVSVEQCQEDAHYPTGTVVATIDEKKEALYEILEGVAWDYIPLTQEAKEMVASSKALVYGSLASRSEVSRHTLSELLLQAPYKVFDVNLRPPFYSFPVLERLLEAADLVKLNEGELKEILHLARRPFMGEEKGVMILRDLFEIQEVILTNGNKGARYYTDELYCEFPIVPVLVKDTVGSGDAFLAGFLAEKLRGGSTEEAMGNAIVLSAFVTAGEGACPEYKKEEYLAFKERAWKT
jgi:fructokinase